MAHSISKGSLKKFDETETIFHQGCWNASELKHHNCCISRNWGPIAHSRSRPRIENRVERDDCYVTYLSHQFSSVTQSCPTLCNPMNCSMPGLPVHHQLLEFTQTHVHRVGDAIQPSHPLSPPSPPALNPSQHQSLFQRVNSLHEVAKVLEFQL